MRQFNRCFTIGQKMARRSERRRPGRPAAPCARFDVREPIGQGTYGTIHECTVTAAYKRVLLEHGVCAHHVDGTFAVKVQSHDTYFWDNFSVLREIDALMRTRAFPGTVDVYDCAMDAGSGNVGAGVDRSYIVMDCYDGTLLQYVQQTRFEERSRHLPFVFTQMLLTMAYLDHHGIAHRDVKPSNLLVRSMPCRASPCSNSDGGDSNDSSNSVCSGCAEPLNVNGCHELPRDCLALFAPFCADLSPSDTCSDTSPPPPPPPPTRRDSGRQFRGDHGSDDGGASVVFQMDEEEDDTGRAGNDCTVAQRRPYRRRPSSQSSTWQSSPTPFEQQQQQQQQRDQQHRPHSLPDERAFLTTSNTLLTGTDGEGTHRGEHEPSDEDATTTLRRYYVHNHLTASSGHHAAAWRDSSDCAGDLAVIDSVPHVVLCDFGLAKQLVPFNDTPCLVTLNFRPPELFVDQNRDYCTNVDIWSLGCILAQCLTGSILFRGREPRVVYRSIGQLLGGHPGDDTDLPTTTVDERCERIRAHLIDTVGVRRLRSVAHVDDLVHLLALMLDPNARTRPSARTLLTHAYVRPYVRRVVCFMCTRRTMPLFGPARVPDGLMCETSRWAFRVGVDVGTHALDPTLGLARCGRKEVHRDLICQWMWQRNMQLGSPFGAVLSAIHNFDRFMSYASAATLASLSSDHMYSLAAIVCFYLTVHYYEAYAVDLSSLIASCGFVYAPSMVRTMITTVLHALHFQVSTPSHWTLYTRHRTLMRMDVCDAAEQRVIDHQVLRLLYLMLRSVAHATAPKAIVLTMAVERIRFVRRFARAFERVVLRPLPPPAPPAAPAPIFFASSRAVDMDCAPDDDL